jgi:hypothetical protein
MQINKIQKNKATRLSGIVHFYVGGRRSDGERERAKGVGFRFRVWVSFLDSRSVGLCGCGFILGDSTGCMVVSSR